MKLINFKTITSTNDYALEYIKENQPVEDVLVLADVQTAGRGRLNGRLWESALGNFHGTYILNLKKFDISQNDSMLLNDITLKCVEEILNDISKRSGSNREITIKSPNDVLVNQKKIAGVLVEILYPYAAIGIGLNLKSSPISIATDVCSEFNYELKAEEFGNILYEKLISKLK